MDLTQFDTTKTASAGVTMQLKHPGSGIGLIDEEMGPVVICLAGSDSDEFRKISHQLAQSRLNSGMDKRGRFKINVAQVEQDSIDVLVNLTKGWKNIVVDNKPLEFSPENAKVLYTRFKWIREQAEEFTTDRANYLGN